MRTLTLKPRNTKPLKPETTNPKPLKTSSSQERTLDTYTSLNYHTLLFEGSFLKTLLCNKPSQQSLAPLAPAWQAPLVPKVGQDLRHPPPLALREDFRLVGSCKLYGFGMF